VGSSSAEKTASRDRILGVAGRRFREKGFDAIGVADLMREAGLTHGGFYRQARTVLSDCTDKPENLMLSLHFAPTTAMGDQDGPYIDAIAL